VVGRSPDNITVRYGNSSIDWQTLSWFIRSLEKNHSIIFRKLSEGVDVDPKRDPLSVPCGIW